MTNPPRITITCVDTRPPRHTIDAHITTHDGTTHRIGHTPHLGWWCLTPCNNRRCKHITTIRELTPPPPTQKEEAT